MFTLHEPIPRKHQGLRHQRQAVWSCCPEQPWQEQSLPMSILYGPLYVNTNTSFNFSDLYLIFVNGHQAQAPLLNLSNRTPTVCAVCDTPLRSLITSLPTVSLSAILRTISINNTYIHNPALQAIWCVQGQTKKISCWMKWLSKVKCNPQALWRH